MRPGTRKTLSILTVFLSVWLSVRYFLPLFSPFLLGSALALAAEPMVSFLHKRVHLPRGVGTAISVSMTFCFLAMAFLLVCAFAVRELRMLTGILPDLEQAAQSGIHLTQNWLLSLSAHAPQSIRPLLQSNVTALFSDGTALVGRISSWFLSLAGNLLSHVPDSALGLGTTMISGYMISAKLPKIRTWILRRIPKQRLQALRNAVGRIRKTLASWLLAQCKLMGVTFVILALGLLLLRIPHALLWALGTCLVDAFPVLGTGTVLIPWSLIYFLQGDNARAIGIASIYIVITLTRSSLEPKLLGSHLGLDPLVTLFTLYAGYKLWGVGGMILAPVLAVVALQLVPEKR